MILSEFVTKYNKSETAIAVEEKHVMPDSGIYEAELEHDNVDEDTLQVNTGASLSGSSLSYTLTSPSDETWKRIIHVETSQPTIYINYETTGDQVEADDVNNLQDAILDTQAAVNVLAEQVTGSSTGFTWNKLMGVGDEGTLKITVQPQNVTITSGNNATFYVAATSKNDITYKWQSETKGSSIWQDIDGATSSSVLVSGASTDLNGTRYRCIVTDTGGDSVISDTATLYVTS